MDADALFLACIRTHINLLRKDYISLLKENPCNKDQVLADFRATLIGLGWGEGLDVYGEGEIFPTYKAFLNWLIAEACTIDIDITCNETNEKPPATEEKS